MKYNPLPTTYNKEINFHKDNSRVPNQIHPNFLVPSVPANTVSLLFSRGFLLWRDVKDANFVHKKHHFPEVLSCG